MIIPNNKEIIYPELLECCEFAIDNFWVNIFEDLAYGKCPYGTYINKNFLCCSYKDKEFSYKIEHKDPQIIYNNIYKLLTDKLGILSKKEKIRKKSDFYKLESKIKNTNCNWVDIKKKNIKELLIELYVINMKNKYSLSNKQAKYLHSIIFIALVFKVISPKDIKYNNGKIEYIEGIEFSKNNINIKRYIYKLDVKTTPEIQNNKKQMIENWEKYTSLIEKNNT